MQRPGAPGEVLRTGVVAEVPAGYSYRGSETAVGHSLPTVLFFGPELVTKPAFLSGLFAVLYLILCLVSF